MFLQNPSSSFQYLILSFNNFEGAVPTEGLFQHTSAFSILGNSKLCGGIPELQLPLCPVDHKQKHSNKKHQISLHIKVVIGVLVSTTVLATLLLAVLCWMRRTKSGSDQSQNNYLHDHYERVSFLELHRATHGFSPTNSIGIGHFGSVFKAIIREGTEPVAVKVLNMIDHKTSKSFMAECEATAKLRTDDERYLTENLSLSQRLNIAIDVASALDYLHNQCETPIVHCDLKPSNILLDEDMVAHVGDFGLAKFLQRKNSNSGTTYTTCSFSPRGTIGYITPDVSRKKADDDEEFEDGQYLHHFCKIALHKDCADNKERKGLGVISSSPLVHFGELVQRKVTLVLYNSQHRQILSISTIRGLMAEAMAGDSVGVTVKYRDRDIGLVRHRDKDTMFHMDRDFNLLVWECGSVDSRVTSPMVCSLLGGHGGAQLVMEEPSLSRRSPACRGGAQPYRVRWGYGLGRVWPWASMALGQYGLGPVWPWAGHFGSIFKGVILGSTEPVAVKIKWVVSRVVEWVQLKLLSIKELLLHYSIASMLDYSIIPLHQCLTVPLLHYPIFTLTGHDQCSIRGEVWGGRNYLEIQQQLLLFSSFTTAKCELPSNFSRNLESLILEVNKLSGTFPKQLCALQKLKTLRLWSNNLTGSLPYDLGNLSSLQFINLGINFLEGGIPDSIGQLKSLYFLSLEENMLSSKLPPSIYNLSSLWTLGLTMNQIADRLPSDIGRTFLPNLRELYIGGNHFFGPLPSSLFNISTLEVLELSRNGFTGKVPDNMGNMQKLQVLGNIPQDIGKLNNLQALTLGNNNLSGRIPSSINNLARLLYLELHHNNFEGVIPNTSNLQSLLELRLNENKLNATLEQVFDQTSHGLLYAYLADNSFTGSLPVEVGNFEYLVDMDVSNNYLEGCNANPRHFSKCKCLLNTWEQQALWRHLSSFNFQMPDHQAKALRKHQISLGLKVAIGVIVSTTVVAALLSVRCWVMRRTKSGTDEIQKASLHDHYERVSFLELHRATDGFSPANSIGTGHFGSVFKAIIREGTSCCGEGNDFKALIFKFMPNGSLEKWLHPVRTDDERYLTENLSLSRRLNIAIDVASALDYLHNQCETPIVHCDLKPSNILLDEDMVAHVGDFGLAKFLQRKNSNSGTTDTTSSFSPRGTIGYIPPGRRPTDEEFEDGLDLHQFCKIALCKEVMKIIDPHVLEHEEEANDDHRDVYLNNSEIQRSTHHESGKTEECITSIIKVGVQCSMPSPISERMEIKNALKELVAAKKLYDSAR
ncbi:hypothetical protein Syun_030921 [Stephania yunnanensis]|uniref:non-specific serine/threonine protein kinase n=1 Tax=Stephania yunnanensis TaxID=152371 RepID=A0AAP0E3D1_9MAGN